MSDNNKHIERGPRWAVALAATLGAVSAGAAVIPPPAGPIVALVAAAAAAGLAAWAGVEKR